MWKKIFLITGFSVLFLSHILFATDKPLGKISFLIGDKGDITVKHKNQMNWQEARLFSEVWNEDQLQTRTESRCEVKLGDGSTIRIGENSSFEFNQRDSQQNPWFHSILNWGKIWIHIERHLLPSEKFEIQAPSAVCAVRGTIYAVEADSTTRISVFKGAVDVSPKQMQQAPAVSPQTKSLKPYEVPGPTQVPGPTEVTLDQWMRIVAGFQIEIRPDSKYQTRPISAKMKSKWIRWNEERDYMQKRQKN